ncbi:MAG: hypothetical protein AAFR41_09040 [Pseudomonadota bacterium]
MSIGPAFFTHLQRRGGLLHAAVLTRDDGHLAPDRMGQAAAGRLRRGIRALEAWLRRVLILMALALEPHLKPANGRHTPSWRPRGLAAPRQALRVFAGERARGDCTRAMPWDTGHAGEGASGRAVWVVPLLARLAALKNLVDAPEARARRLAFHLARQRPGPILAPVFPGRSRGQPFTTETGAVFEALPTAIITASRSRPPPLGPRPRAGPRARWL